MTTTVPPHHDEEAVERLERAEGRLGRWGMIILAVASALMAIAFFTLGGQLN